MDQSTAGFLFFVHGAQPAWHFFFVLTVGDKTKENLISS